MGIITANSVISKTTVLLQNNFNIVTLTLTTT